MSKIRKSFILHHDSLNVLDDLTNEQAGLLFKAIKAYHLGDDLELDTLTNIAMSPFKNQFDRDTLNYEKMCEKNRLIAVNRHSTKSTTGKTGNQSLPKATKSTDNDSKSKNDSDSDSKVTKDIVVSTPFIYPVNLNVAAWDKWIAFRKVARFKKYKSTATMDKLAGMGNFAEQLLIVQNSIDCEYQGLFALKKNNSYNGQHGIDQYDASHN